MGWGRRPTAAIFSSSKGSCWNTENLPDRRPIDGAAVTVDGRAEGMPFTKKKVEPGPYPPAAGKVNGWRYRVLDSGEVFVGTLPPSAGRDKRFKFRLTTYGDQAVDPEACIRDEIESRRTPENIFILGYKTPRFGPDWDGVLLGPTCFVLEYTSFAPTDAILLFAQVNDHHRQWTYLSFILR